MEQDTHIPQWTLGDRLRKARAETGLSQEEFARLILVSEGTVANYEAGATQHPKRLVLEQWAKATGVPYWWLAGADEHMVTGSLNPRWTCVSDPSDLDTWNHDPIRDYVCDGQLDLAEQWDLAS